MATLPKKIPIGATKEIKSKNSAFKELRSSSNCDPDKLKKHFERHFNTNLDKSIPLELHKADFINKLKEIPAYIIDVTDESDMMHLALIENIQRDNLNPMEESEAYAVLQNEFSLSQASIASSVGKSRSTIANSLRLLQLPSEARKYLKQNKISAGHARAILACKTNPAMLSLLKMIIRNDLSVRAAEKISHGSAKVKSVKKTIKSTKNKSVRSLENELIAILGTKVHLNSKADKTGTILIEFFSEDDLSRILELLRSIDD